MKLLAPLVSLVHTLPLLAMAVSFRGSPRSQGLPISIRKRGSTPNAHGSASPHFLQSNLRQSVASVCSALFISFTSLTRHLSKVQDGFSAYERNTGERHPLDRLPDLQQEKRNMGSIPLAPADQQLWYGSISVGTPAKKFLGAPCPFSFSYRQLMVNQWTSTRGAAICSYLGHSVEKPAQAMLCTTRLRATVPLTLGEVSTLSLAMVQLPLSRDTPTLSPLRGCP